MGEGDGSGDTREGHDWYDRYLGVPGQQGAGVESLLDLHVAQWKLLLVFLRQGQA